jgi:phosphinothricin acetyltransferase
MSTIIRPATEQDLDPIHALFTDYIATSTATFATQPVSEAERLAWWRAHQDRFPVTVAEVDGAFAGWACLSAYAGRCAYRFTAESSVYVRRESHGRGIGLALMRDLLDRAKAAKFHSIVAVIEASQTPSVRLHERLGFREAGRLR